MEAAKNVADVSSAKSDTSYTPVPAAEGMARRLTLFLISQRVWLILVAGAAILFLRRPDQLANPQLWAEDGIFFFQARVMGAEAFITELAGYYHLAPRLIAAVANLVDPAWVPHVFVASALVLTLYVMSLALSCRCPLPYRWAVALAIVVVPDSAEVLLNTVNLQWVFAAGFVLILISREATDKWRLFHDVAAVLLFGLTGPFSILLVPFFAWRAFKRQTAGSLVILIAVGTCAVVQAMTILKHPQATPAEAVLDTRALLAFPGWRVLAAPVVGPWLPTPIPWNIAALVSLLLFALMAVIGMVPGRNRLERVILCLAFVTFLAASVYRTWPALPVLCIPGQAARYVYILQLIWLWILLAASHERFGFVRILGWGLAGWIAGFGTRDWLPPPLPDMHWNNYVAELRAGKEVNVTINPGWSFPFPERQVERRSGGK